jgi:hypothetical protein
MGLKPPACPLLQLTAARAILQLDRTTLAALAELVAEIRDDATREATRSWKKRKAPMARYRLDVATHAAALLRKVRWARGAPSPTRATTVGVDDTGKPRSSRAATRNPILRMRALTGLLHLPIESRVRLGRLALDLAAECSVRAEASWRGKRRSTAVEWRITAVYAGHLARALLHAPSAQCEIHWDAGPVPSAPQHSDRQHRS